MWKKVIISIVVFIFLEIIVINVFGNKGDNSNNIAEENSSNETKKIEEISEALVDDDCTREWEDYKNYVKELEQASSLYENEKLLNDTASRYRMIVDQYKRLADSQMRIVEIDATLPKEKISDLIWKEILPIINS